MKVKIGIVAVCATVFLYLVWLDFNEDLVEYPPEELAPLQTHFLHEDEERTTLESYEDRGCIVFKYPYKYFEIETTTTLTIGDR